MPVERETIVTSDPAPTTVVRTGSPFGGMIAALVGAVVLVLLVLWLLNGGLNFSGNGNGGSLTVNVPDVQVNTPKAN